MKDCLIIFTRKPEKGKVKTRLAKGVGDDKALKIYKYLLNHTAKITAKVKAHRQVYYTEAIAKKDVWDDDIFEKKVQIDGDLGDKMLQAFEQAFQDGFEKVVIIGSDLYDINHKLIDKAFAKLDHNDAVIGPATDGGYYLLGTKSIFSEIFKNKPWGTDEVLNLTLKNLKSKQVALLEEKNDIDYKEDAMSFDKLRKIINT